MGRYGGCQRIGREVDLNHIKAAPGSPLRVTARGLGPGEVVAVTVHSAARRLKLVRANSAGVVRTRVRLPGTCEQAERRIVVTGTKTHLRASTPLRIRRH